MIRIVALGGRGEFACFVTRRGRAAARVAGPEGRLSWREGAVVACAPRATSGGGARGRRGLDTDHGKIRYERIRLTRVSVINYTLDAFLTYPDVVRYGRKDTARLFLKLKT